MKNCDNDKVYKHIENIFNVSINMFISSCIRAYSIGQRALFKFISIIVSAIGITLFIWVGTPYILGKPWQELQFGEYLFVMLLAVVMLSVVSFVAVVWTKASIRRGVEIE